MSRREFPKRVKREALDRAAGQCEGKLAGSDERCPCALNRGKYHFDHDLPDWMGGPPTLENCVVLCIPCHHDKTSGIDAPAIAKAKRIRDRERGIRSPSRLRGQGFRSPPPQKSASRKVVRRFSPKPEASA